MTTLSIGKLRGLQQCTTERGALAVLAIDHRGSLQRALNPATPEQVDPREMSAFKIELVSVMAITASAILLDPQVGAAQCIAADVLPGHVGLVLSLEESGYTGDPQARHSRVLPGWSVAQAKRMGASAVKLLAYYHPDATTASEIEALVKQVADECLEQDLTFFLEVVTYSPHPERPRLASPEKRQVVVEAARRLVVPGVDVLKTEFPLNIDEVPDEGEWGVACADLSDACPVPWILLSGTADYGNYLRMVTVACRAGASGVAVGRAVWREAPGLRGPDRTAFLFSQAHGRMGRITALCNALARPWTDFFTLPDVDSEWYKTY